MTQPRECRRSVLDFTADLFATRKDADTFADALAKLCRVGYPQSPPELRQELIVEQFVRGQSDPGTKEIPLGGHPDSEGQETSDSD